MKQKSMKSRDIVRMQHPEFWERMDGYRAYSDEISKRARLKMDDDLSAIWDRNSELREYMNSFGMATTQEEFR